MNAVRTNTANDPSDPTTVSEMHSGPVRMAYRLAAQYRGDLLYVQPDDEPGPHAASGWLSWNGAWWTNGHPGAPTRAVLDVLRRALAEAPHDTTMRHDVAVCESAAGVADVLELAAALGTFAITQREFDSLREKAMVSVKLAGYAQRVLDAPAVRRGEALHDATLLAVRKGINPKQVLTAMLRTAQKADVDPTGARLIIESVIKRETAESTR